MHASPGAAQQTSYEAKDLTVQITGASDYVFRGVSQTNEDPALQISLDYSHESGFLAGGFASNVKLLKGIRADSGDVELDLYAGYRRRFGSDWSAHVALVRYGFPTADDRSDRKYHEIQFSANYLEIVNVSIAYSKDAFSYSRSSIFSKGESYYLETAAGNYIGETTFLGGGIGYAKIDNLVDRNYLYGNIGITRNFKKFSLDLNYYFTDSAAEEIFGDVAENRLVARLHYAFP